MPRIKVDIKSALNHNFHTVCILHISDTDYKILQDRDANGYDDAWDRLCDRIKRDSIPEALDPDWCIYHIDFN